MNKFVVGVCLLTVAALTAACGSSSKTAATSSSDSSTASSPAASSPASSSAPASPTASSSSPAAGAPDQAALAAVNLTAADLPAGWTSTPHVADPSDDADQAALVKCVGGTDTTADKAIETDSPDFALKDESASSSATSYKTQASIDSDIALLHSAKVVPCFEAALKSELVKDLPAGSKLGAIKVDVTRGTATDPSNLVAVVSGVIAITVSGTPADVYVASAYITGRQTEAEVDIESPFQPISVDLFDSLLKTVAGRAAAL